jgi:hypothetical protein
MYADEKTFDQLDQDVEICLTVRNEKGTISSWVQLDKKEAKRLYRMADYPISIEYDTGDNIVWLDLCL